MKREFDGDQIYVLTGFSAPSSDSFSKTALRFAIVGASKGIAEAIVAAAALKVFLIPALESSQILNTQTHRRTKLKD